MSNRIDRFNGKYRFLSNFYPSVVLSLLVDEENEARIECSTVEHAFQAAKAVQPHEAAWVLAAETPSLAKRRGRKVVRRADWDDIRIDVMRDLLRQKFTDPELRSLLLATGDAELIEGNWWGDIFWGMVQTPAGLVGDNHLGKLLMEIREELKA